jgi:hypothetical protein
MSQRVVKWTHHICHTLPAIHGVDGEKLVFKEWLELIQLSKHSDERNVSQDRIDLVGCYICAVVVNALDNALYILTLLSGQGLEAHLENIIWSVFNMEHRHIHSKLGLDLFNVGTSFDDIYVAN